MKTFLTAIVGVFITLSSFYATAQEKIPVNPTNYNKPRLFSDVPQKINLKVSDMEFLFSYSVGSSVSAKFSKDFHFKGIIVSKADDPVVTSVVIKSTNRQGAVFTFTRIKNENGNFIYRGRILSRENGDAFEIVNENGQYILQKKNDHELVLE